MRLSLFRITVMSACALASEGLCMASAITNAAGMGSPAFTQTFETPTLAFDSVIGTQFGDVTSTTLFYDGNNGAGNPNCVFYQESGNCVTNFTTNGGTYNNTFSIFFSVPQTYADFAMITGGQDSETFTAKLNGTTVDSFIVVANSVYDQSSTPVMGVGNYFGFFFSTQQFDEIDVATTGSHAVLIDNLQYSASAVPEPGTIALFGTGLVGLAVLVRKKRAA